ncbi:MAG: sugar phosphate isomerase/epimerase [Bacteroidales bacterium]|nr:sugar phosphate isomerase/epimerase [Bacteroidales bacterium]
MKTPATTILLVLILSSNCFAQEYLGFTPELGVCTSIKNHEIVAAAGFDYIEESVGRFLIPGESEEAFEKNLAILKESSIPIRACNGFLPGSLKTTGPETHHPQILEYAETAFRRAQIAGIKRIVYGSGGSRNYPDGFDHETAWNQFAELLIQMGPIAEKYDVIIAIEPLRKGESNLINRVDEGLELVLKVNHPNIQVLGDIFHMMREDEEPESFIEARKYLKHTHIAEIENRTAPGLAGDDLSPYLQALKQANYEGGISIEGGWGDNFEKNLIISRAYLQGQINALN